MNGYVAFLKKEWMEAVRSYKLFLMGGVFLLLGILNPMTAKLMPVILENFMPDGMTIQIEETTALDSWMQFYSNIPQIGMVVLVIMFSGMMASEWNKGTLIPILTKGLKRGSVLAAKYTIATGIWTASYVLCAFISWAYTVYFWPNDKVHYLLFSMFCLWMFGLLLLSIVILGSVLFNTMALTMLFTGGSVVIMFLIQMVPKAAKYCPTKLQGDNLNLLKGAATCSEFYCAIGISIGIIIFCLITSILVFNRRKI